MAAETKTGNNIISYERKKRFWNVLESPYVVHLVLGIALLSVITPLIWMFLTALQSNADARAVSYLPEQVTLEAFYSVLINQEFWKAIGNSLIISGSATIITMALGTPAGYIFSRYRFPFDNLVFISIIGARFFPTIGLIVPYYQIMASFGLLNTKIGIIIANVYLWLPLVIYMMRNFFMSIPKELDESARVDGCTKAQAFRKIIFPLVMPGFSAAAILTFLFSWREFPFALIVSSDLQSMPVSVAPYLFVGDQAVLWADLAASSVLAMLPTILIVIFFQRYIVSGLTGGALKG